MSNIKIEETAAGGSVSAHSIAVRTDGGANIPMQKREDSFLNFMAKFNSRLQNKVDMKPVATKKPFSKTLKEEVSLDQVYSKLGGIRNQGRKDNENSQTYGVEDDDGNLMKITVKADQAEKFEVALAQELGELENYKMTGRGGHGKEVSIAEVLYNLKQDFDIITVEFPEIAKDKVYNADKVTDPENVGFDEEDFQKPDADNDDFSDEEEFNTDDENPTDGEDPLGEFGDDDTEGDEESLEDGEDDLGTEFGEDDGENDASSLLRNIVQMLTKQAEAQAAEAEAEAEKSRALQAEYSAMAAKEEMHKQEELAKMERELDAQKSTEKDAKKLADLARYKLRSVSEGGTFLGTVRSLLELDDLDSEATVRFKRREVQKIKDPVEKRLRMQGLNSERRLIKHKTDADREQEEEDKRREEELRGEDRGNNNRPSTIYNNRDQQR